MQERQPRVRIVVLNYNGGALTLRCIEHLQALDWPSDALEIVCVDNASADGSAEEIERRFPGVVLRRNDRNGGFPANNLGLVDLGSVDYVGLINNDAFVDPQWLRPMVGTLEADPTLGAVSAKLVLEPRFAEIRVVSSAAVPGVGDSRRLGVMVLGAEVDGPERDGPWVGGDAHVGEGGWGRESAPDGTTFEWTSGDAIVRVPAPVKATRVRLRLGADRPVETTVSTAAGEVRVTIGPEPQWVDVPLAPERIDVLNNVGSRVFRDGHGADIGFLEADTGQYDEPADVFAWCGGSVLFRPEYLADVGLFDEDFFLYYEDTDLSWRGQARGWRYRTVPEATARHIHAATSVEGSDLFAFHVERNRLMMLVKNAPGALVRREVLRFVLVTLSYARRDIVGPLVRRRRPRFVTVRRRSRAFAGFLRLLPRMMRKRRQLRARRTVDDRTILERLVAR